MYNKKEVLQKVDMLYSMWKKGSLGGEVMPEDAKYIGISHIANSYIFLFQINMGISFYFLFV